MSASVRPSSPRPLVVSCRRFHCLEFFVNPLLSFSPLHTVLFSQLSRLSFSFVEPPVDESSSKSFSVAVVLSLCIGRQHASVISYTLTRCSERSNGWVQGLQNRFRNEWADWSLVGSSPLLENDGHPQPRDSCRAERPEDTRISHDPRGPSLPDRHDQCFNHHLNNRYILRNTSSNAHSL